MGPHGTFTEQASQGQPDLAAADTHLLDSIPDVLNGLVTGDVDLGFVQSKRNRRSSKRHSRHIGLRSRCTHPTRSRTRCPVEFAGSPRTQLTDIHTVVSFSVA